MPKARAWGLIAADLWQEELNLKPRQPYQTDDEYIKQVAMEAGEQKSDRELLEILKEKTGISRTRQALSLYFLDLGVPNRKPGLTEKEKGVIIYLARKGLTSKQIAKEINRSERGVQDYVRSQLHNYQDLHKPKCRHCGERFERKTMRKIYCSYICAARSHYGTKQNMHEKHECRECGAPFYKHAGKKVLCDQCGDHKEVVRRYKERQQLL